MTKNETTIVCCPHCQDMTEHDVVLGQFTCGQCDEPFSGADGRIAYLERVMRECCDAIREQDDIGALRMMEVALNARR